MKSKIFIAWLLILCIVFPLWAQSFTLPTAATYISVAVTGYVEKPGIYKLSVIDRLSEALAQADEQSLVNTPTPDMSLEKLKFQEKEKTHIDSIAVRSQALRSVSIIRAGEETSYDFQLFLRSGDMSQNPLLRDGDVVVVNPIAALVTISGAVYFPGDYEYRPGDTLAKLLILAKGFKPEADLKQVRLYRYSDNMFDYTTEVIDLSSAKSNPSLLNIPIQAHDRVMVAQNSQFRRGWEVQINGHVASPGTYMINETTTLYDILLQAGGPTDKADLGSAVMINRAMYQRESPDLLRLQILNMSSMTPMEYNFMRSTLRQLKGKYSLDIALAWNSKGKAGNPTLRDGDQIFVPEIVDMVWVSGQVRSPGLVPWVEGKDYLYYVNQAGGFTNNRKLGGIRIIRNSSGNWIKPGKNVAIRSGDQIFIPETKDRDIWLDIKDVVTLVSQVITIVIGVNTMSK